MSFGHPFLLLTLLVVPLAIALVLARRATPDALRGDVHEPRRPRFGGRQALDCGASSRRACSCSRSRSLRRARAAAPLHAHPVRQGDVILVVDVSGSMHATDVKPTRLGAAQEAVRTFLERVPKHVRVGLIAFSSEPEVAAPPTTDRDLVRAVAERARLPPGLRRDRDRRRARRGRRARQEGGARRERRQTIAYTVAKSQTRSSRSSSSPTGSRRGASSSRWKARSARRRRASRSTRSRSERREGVLTTPVRRFRRQRPARRIPVPPDPATLGAIARLTGRQVLQRAVGRRAAVGVQGARLQAGPRQGPQGSHQRGRLRSRRSYSSPRGILSAALGTSPAVARATSSARRALSL